MNEKPNIITERVDDIPLLLAHMNRMGLAALLEQAVLVYRSEYLVERSLGRLKGRPLSLTPMYVLLSSSANTM